MKYPSRFFLGFAGLALFAAGGGYAYTAYLDAQLSAAIAACQEESSRDVRAVEARRASATSGEAAKKVANPFDVFDERAGNSTTKTAPHARQSPDKRITQEKEELYAALRKADVAGDAAGAKKLAAYIKSIEAEGSQATPTPSSEEGPWTQYKYLGLVCDPTALYQTSFDVNGKEPPGAQGNLLRAYRASVSGQASDTGYILAFILLLIGVIPAAWYFLLRRLSEVAAAVRGK